MRSLVRAPAALGIVVCGALIACGDDATSPDQTTLTGTYTLVSVENESLPYVILELGDLKSELLSGSATFNANGTFTATLTLRETDGGSSTTTTESASGTYVRAGNSVTLTIPNDEDSPYQATLSSNALTFDFDGLTFRFQR